MYGRQISTSDEVSRTLYRAQAAKQAAEAAHQRATVLVERSAEILQRITRLPALSGRSSLIAQAIKSTHVTPDPTKCFGRSPWRRQCPPDFGAMSGAASAGPALGWRAPESPLPARHLTTGANATNLNPPLAVGFPINHYVERAEQSGAVSFVKKRDTPAAAISFLVFPGPAVSNLVSHRVSRIPTVGGQ